MILAALLTADHIVVAFLFAIAVVLRSTYSTRLTDEQRTVEQFARSLRGMARATEPKEMHR